MAGSPAPDGLKIRQIRDATVIRVLPYTASLGVPAAAILLGWALTLGVLGTTSARLAVPAAVIWTLGWTAWAWTRSRRARQVLEVYVGKRQLELVWSLDGVERRRVRVALDGVIDPRADATGVGWGGPSPVHLPMEAHSDEARAWMAIHLGAAGIGARRPPQRAPDTPMSPP